MLFTTHYFTEVRHTVSQGLYPTKSAIKGEITIKGQTVQIEESLYQYPKLTKSLEGLSQKESHCFFNGEPALPIAGPMCLMSLLVEGKMVDRFLIGFGGYYIIVSAYVGETKKTL